MSQIFFDVFVQESPRFRWIQKTWRSHDSDEVERREKNETSFLWLGDIHRYSQYLQKLDLLQILEILYISVMVSFLKRQASWLFSERYQASEVLYHHGPPSNKICRLGRPLPLDENAYVSSNYSTQHARVYFFIHYRCRYMYIIVY